MSTLFGHLHKSLGLKSSFVVLLFVAAVTCPVRSETHEAVEGPVAPATTAKGTFAPAAPHLKAYEQPLSMSKRKPRFEDLYECYIIVDVAYALAGEEDQEQLDRDEVLPLLAQAKYGHTAFEPAYELFLYDDEGVRYIVYVSSNCRHLRIDSNYFTLSRSRARRLKSWLW